MKIHRFECKNKHIFFIPLNLPQDVKIKCPLCSSKDIKMSTNEFVVR